MTTLTGTALAVVGLAVVAGITCASVPSITEARGYVGPAPSSQHDSSVSPRGTSSPGSVSPADLGYVDRVKMPRKQAHTRHRE
jgi:hypothetical protein